MKPGSVVLTSILQADNSIKTRPAVLIRQVPPFRDWLLCPVSTQLRHLVPGLDILIERGSENYASMHLAAPSIIRTAMLQAIDERKIRAEVGSISAELYEVIIQKLTAWLKSGNPLA